MPKKAGGKASQAECRHIDFPETTKTERVVHVSQKLGIGPLEL